MEQNYRALAVIDLFLSLILSCYDTKSGRGYGQLLCRTVAVVADSVCSCVQRHWRLIGHWTTSRFGAVSTLGLSACPCAPDHRSWFHIWVMWPPAHQIRGADSFPFYFSESSVVQLPRKRGQALCYRWKHLKAVL